ASHVLRATNVRVWRRAGEELELAATIGHADTIGRRVRIADERAPVCIAIAQRQTVYIPDAELRNRSGHQLARQRGVRTVVATPMWREGEAIGAIAADRREVDAFLPQEIALVETFAAQ